VERCATWIEARHPFKRTRRGIDTPVLDIEVFWPSLPGPAKASFVVDTGCEYDLILARPLRDALVAGGVPFERSWIEWGAAVRAQRFGLQALIGGKWRVVEAHFPEGPEVDENLVGLPMLRFEAVCLRPPLEQTWVGRALR